MTGLILLAAVLLCPVVMGTAMLLMWREMRRGHAPEHPSSPPDAQTEGGSEMTSTRDEAHAPGA